MRHVERNHFDAREPIRSIYQGGLRQCFAACHAPVPPRMEELLHRLEDCDRKDDIAKEARR
jgi:hypothetical protein